MSAVATAIVGGAVIGGVIASNAAKDSAKTQSRAMDSASQAQLEAAQLSADAMRAAAGQAAGATIKAANIGADASKYATDKQWQMYEQARADQLPWIKAGKRALGTLEQKINAGPGEFTESPGYQFRLDQGNKNILSNSAATGNLASGRTLKALQEYGQDYASYEYDKFLNQYYQSLSPLQSLAGVGMSAATSLGNQGISTGAGMAQTTMAGAGMQAGAYNNLAGIYGNLGNSLASNYMAQGRVIGNNYMNQGNIAAANSIRQGSIWSGVVNDMAMAYGRYGSSSTPSSYDTSWTQRNQSWNSQPADTRYMPLNF